MIAGPRELPAPGFVQREPAVGEAATEATEVRFLQDGTTLFVGIRARDAQPDGVIARQMRRDGRLPDDDAVARIQRDLGDRSAVGMILTNRQQQGGRANRLLGFDADLAPHPQLDLGGFWARTWTPDRAGGDDVAFGGRGRWRTSTLSASFDFLEIGDEFRPEAGFLLRRGVRRFFPDVFVEPRPDWPGIRSLFLGARADVFTDTDGTVQSVSAVLKPRAVAGRGLRDHGVAAAGRRRLHAPDVPGVAPAV